MRVVLEVGRELGEIDDVESFQFHLLTHLKRLVPYDIASWNVISLPSFRSGISAVDPVDCRQKDDEVIFGTYAHQNPLVSAGVGKVRKFSDYLTLRQLHALDIYDFVYRPREVQHQIAFTLPAPQESVIGIALSRRTADFSERDRAILELAVPLVSGSYQRVGLLASMQRTLAVLEETAEVAGQAVVILQSDGRIQHMTAAAERALSQ